MRFPQSAPPVEGNMRGDCSIRVDDAEFSDSDIAACAARQGLLALELELDAPGPCRCPACSATPAGTQPALAVSEIAPLLAQAAALGCRRCTFIPDRRVYPAVGHILPPLVQEAHRHGLRVELFADGTEITSELALFLHRHRVAVSLPGDALAHHTSITALATLKQAGYTSPDAPPLAVRLTIRQENFAELPDLWRRARSQNLVPRLQILTPHPDDDSPPPAIPPQRVMALLEHLARIDASEFQQPWKLPPAVAARSCNRHLFACHVTPCGTVFACAGIAIPLGNIRAEPLADILGLSEVLENLRAFSTKVNEPCRTCCQTVDCYGCRGAAYQLTGDYLAGDPLCPKAPPTGIPTLPADASGLIPHGPSMRLVDRIHAVGERRAVTEWVVPHDSPLVDAAGRLDECCFIELIAQAFAAAHGFHLSADEQPLHKGLLLGVRNLSLAGAVSAGDTVRVEVRKLVRFGDFSVIEGTILRPDGRILGRGELKLWRSAAAISAQPRH
jgi:predicted hotdog family 3-hydroxylacyl-ACP dehydratase